MKNIDPKKNYDASKKAIGYVSRKKAKQKDYDRIGFMSGLEVHQQLKTKHKLFCRCPAGVFNKNDDFNAELIRHMRPTLSELGEYDGTALMEFKTRKEITYRINNKNTCTYEIDDTPPFPIDREALEYALEISLLSKLNIVGEVHITRKQYLDGSIPAGFQRTAILGVEGEIPLKNKKVRLIQLSIEEDSAREISDIGHKRLYKTDRLGMPLIETVTYPEMVNPDEVMEAADYIRFLNRSTGKVRTGMGAGREDVNVSCKGGTRVEIKGVAHNKWIPELTHIEAYRQWALLAIRDILKKSVKNQKDWKINYEYLDFDMFDITYEPIKDAKDNNYKLVAINLPGFAGVMSHFTQPNTVFANEIKDRLKVIACLEKPNMVHTEDFEPVITDIDKELIAPMLKAENGDAQIIIWGPEEDMETALDVIEERCKMALEGVPEETRKSFVDGTTIFERVLPGADRMYPDTDSAPIPLAGEYIDKLAEGLPVEVVERFKQLKKWKIPADTYNFILKNNLVPLIEKIVKDLKIDAKFVGTFLGHKVKFIEGRYKKGAEFEYDLIYNLFAFLKKEKLNINLAKQMLILLFQHPQMELSSVLAEMKYKKRSKAELIAPIGFLKEKYKEIGNNKSAETETDWVMGELRKQALGNIDLIELRKEILNS